MNRKRATGPEVLRLRLHQRTSGALDEPLPATPLSMRDAENDQPEEQSQFYPCEFGESETAGEAPYWATWGF
jgi:hypothetical protein